MRLASLTFSLALCSILLLLHTLESHAQILTLTPSLSLGERYDDNIFQTRDNKADDFVTTVTPALELRYSPTSDTDLNFEYRPSFELFAKNSDQNQVSQNASVRFATPLTRLFSLNLRDTFVLTKEPGDRIVEIDEATGLRTVSREARSRTIRNSADVALQVQLAPRVPLGLVFRSLLEDVSVSTEVDEFRYTVGADLGYLVNVARGSRVFVSSDVTFHTFSANGPAARDEPDFRVVTVNTGFQHAFSPKLSAHITVGYAVTESDAPDDNDSGIVIDAGVVRTLRTGQASFDYRRHFTSGGGEGGQVLADTFVALFSSRISPKVTASLGGNLSFFDFKNADDDRLFFTVRPNLTYNVLRFWTLSLAYRYAVVNFKESVRADETGHRLSFTSRFTLRAGLFLAVTYRYRTRRFSSGLTENRELDEYNRNEILLTLTYGPTFRF
jgi:hypothetical protein